MADKALLVGVNKYENINDLQGCINDVDNVEKLLIDSFAFDSGNIKRLEDKDVLYDNIVDGFDWLFDEAVAGDRLVFHFSGHGSFINSASDDEAVDELLCLYNMDWKVLDSYLIDDDLGDLLEGVPEGAHMTVILDACHSGTGTKAISRDGKTIKNATPSSRLLIVEDAARTISKGLTSDFKTRSAKSGKALFTEKVKPPLARFVVPPAIVRNKIKSAKLNRVGEKLRSMSFNHQLLAGADARQTAADAFIDNKYQGAFTFHFCSASRKLGADVAVMNIVDQAKSDMKATGFQQTPQLEGIGQDGKLFGGEAKKLPEVIETIIPPDEPVLKPAPESGEEGGQTRIDVLSQLIRVQEKFLDLGNRFLDSETAGLPGRGLDQAIPRGIERIVYVHGISQHRQGFSNSWFAAMSPHLGRSLPRVEVVWSDLVNPRNFQRSIEASDEARKLKQAIQNELKKREKKIIERSPDPGAAGRSVDRSGGFMLDDFIRYMAFEETRNQILDRFKSVVQPALERGETLHIVSHSWGTVVAYEGLRLMDQLSLSGRVQNLFTVGSALSVSAVQWNLFSRMTDGRRPKCVTNIINLDAGGDFVGGPIAGTFSINEEHLSLTPTGCWCYPFTNTALSVSCAHSSYFNSRNVATNRDIFARWINRPI